MPLKVYIGDKFSHIHETEIFNSLIKELKKKFDQSEELIILIGNYYYNNQEFDATIIKKNSIIVIDFKKYGGEIVFSENGKWFAGSKEVKGGNRVNPFIQLRSNKFSLLNFFKNNEHLIIKSDKAINYGHINAMVIFHDPIKFDKKNLSPNLRQWFHITDFDNCIQLIENIRDSEINYTNEEMLNIINVLNVDDYFQFEDSVDQVRKKYNSVKTKHELTESQLNALKLISGFIDDETKKIFILNGAAGTGKTYLIKEIVTLLLEKEKSDFKILAPTGRACSNIREKIIHDVRTIHSQIYERTPDNDVKIKADDEEETKIYELYFDIKNNVDSVETLYIIDECSLLSDKFYKSEIFNFGSNKLLSDVLKYIKLLDSNRKLILIGDDKQIQRGNFEISSLNTEYFKKELNIEIDNCELNEIVRYRENSTILKSATKIRESIESEIYNEFTIKPDGNSIIKLNKESIHEIYASLDKEKSVIIKYKNEDCNKTNQWVKTNVMHNKLEVVMGDLLMFYKNYFLRKTNSYSNFPDYDHISNGEIGKVTWIGNSEQIPVRYGRKNPKEILLKFHDIKIQLSNGSEHLIKIFDNFIFSDKTEITNEELIGFMVRFTKEFQLKNGEWPNPNKIGPVNYYKAIQSDEYFNAARVKHAYSITCHKAQGSEWQNVVVDFNGFTGYKEDFFRWSYTAITRAVDKLFIINEPKIYPYIKLNWTDNYTVLDTDIVNILFFNKSNISSENLQELSVIFAIPNDNSEFFKFFTFLYGIFLPKQIAIDKVEHNLRGYYVRYHLNKSDKKAALNFTFDNNYNFRKPTIVNNATNDNQFATECINYILDYNYEFDINTSIDSVNNLLIKKFIADLSNVLKKIELKILSIEHLEYIERIVFKKNIELCVLHFNYNDDGFFTTVRPIKATSNEIIQEIKIVVNDLKNYTN